MPTDYVRKAALIAHPLDADLFRSFIRFLRPDKTWRDELLIKLFEWAPSFKTGQLDRIDLGCGGLVDGTVFMVPFLPEMRDIKLRQVVKKVEEALDLAAAQGCTVAALGAFTSIVLQGLEADMEKKHGIRITSGNSLTAATIIRSVEETTSRFGLTLDDLTVGIIGASGDIGSACAGWFGSRVKRLILTGRGMQPLEEFAKRNADLLQCETKLSTNNQDAVNESDVLVFVTSAYTSLFTQNDFRPGQIVCDASAPVNVQIEGQPRNDVFVYHGGILSLPCPLDVGFEVGLASPYHFYACQIEGLLIALDDSLPCSWGRGNITQEKLEAYMTALGRYPALKIAFSCAERAYTEEEMTAYASSIPKMADAV